MLESLEVIWKGYFRRDAFCFLKNCNDGLHTLVSHEYSWYVQSKFHSSNSSFKFPFVSYEVDLSAFTILGRTLILIMFCGIKRKITHLTGKGNSKIQRYTSIWRWTWVFLSSLTSATPNADWFGTLVSYKLNISPLLMLINLWISWQRSCDLDSWNSVGVMWCLIQQLIRRNMAMIPRVYLCH